MTTELLSPEGENGACDVGHGEQYGAGGRGAQRAVGEGSAAAPGRVVRAGVPDPELVEQPKRRRFSAEYKLRVLREVEACSRPGEIGALLRREGLYSSLLSEWRKQRDAGSLEALGRPRGRIRATPGSRRSSAPRSAPRRSLRRRGG